MKFMSKTEQPKFILDPEIEQTFRRNRRRIQMGQVAEIMVNNNNNNEVLYIKLPKNREIPLT